MKYLLCVCCFIVMFSCGDDDETPVMEPEMVICSTVIEPTFSITIRRESDNSLLEGVTITIMDDSFTAVLTEVSTGVYEFPEERFGDYQVRIEKDGFQTIITAEISPEEDECGLVTVVLAYELEEL